MNNMDPNPYESPQTPSEPRASRRPWIRWKRKPLWGYAVAVVAGWFIGGALLIAPLADLDDAGGLQGLIGAFLGLVIYAMLF